MAFCADCWVKNVEVANWYGGGIYVQYSARSEFNTVYVHHCWDSVNSGGEYPIMLIDTPSTEISSLTASPTSPGREWSPKQVAQVRLSLITIKMTRCTMRSRASADYWVEMGVNASHYSGPHHVLFEGTGEKTWITTIRMATQCILRFSETKELD